MIVFFSYLSKTLIQTLWELFLDKFLLLGNDWNIIIIVIRRILLIFPSQKLIVVIIIAHECHVKIESFAHAKLIWIIRSACLTVLISTSCVLVIWHSVSDSIWAPILSKGIIFFKVNEFDIIS